MEKKADIIKLVSKETFLAQGFNPDRTIGKRNYYNRSTVLKVMRSYSRSVLFTYLANHGIKYDGK